MAMNDLNDEEAKRWAPVRRGRIYCSPGCGFDCTYAEYKKQCEIANTLAARLGGSAEGWEPRVWDNLGWHHEVTKASMTVSFDGSLYHVIFNCSPFAIVEYAKSPEHAIKCAIQRVHGRVTEIFGVLHSFGKFFYVVSPREPKPIDIQPKLPVPTPAKGRSKHQHLKSHKAPPARRGGKGVTRR